MNLGWTIGLAGWLACGAGWAADWAEIPRHATRAGTAGGFELGRCETTVAEFVEFLNGAETVDFPETAQIGRGPGGTYAAKQGLARQAVSEVTLAEAATYCAWRSRKEGRPVRLPTEAEWEVAARGGIDGAPFPWGWGAKPSELAQFDAEGPAPRGGRFAANGFGLFDMAGNLYEWCAPEPDLPEGKRVARGGSWAEHDPALLEVAHRQFFPADYRGRDVGFRALREAAKEP
jgi:formylglycine-generating enzyme required for sulfatase activity